MASKKAAQQFQWLARRPRAAVSCSEAALPMRQVASSRRHMATVSEVPIDDLPETSKVPPPSETIPTSITTSISPPESDATPPPHTVLTTVHSFPSLEPLRFAYYPTTHLHLPLRRDILHQAVRYEASHSRQGTANTKWRDEVHGSHKKHHPQKGMGLARAGDKQSPIRRGGGVAFGPKPRDFGIGLPRKVYDLAFRTALSHRYRRGELILVDSFKSPRTSAPYYMSQMFAANRMGNANGRSLLVARERHAGNDRLWRGVERVGYDARIVDTDEVDVKMLLEMGRVVLEEGALNEILRRHARDLVRPVTLLGQPREGEAGLERRW